MWTSIKNFFNTVIWDWIKRNMLWIAIGIIAALLVNPQSQELRTLQLVVLFEAVAIGLSAIALYCYTNIKFTRSLFTGDDDKFNSVEQHGNYIVIAAVFVGVHLLLGLIVLGIYLPQFVN